MVVRIMMKRLKRFFEPDSDTEEDNDSATNIIDTADSDTSTETDTDTAVDSGLDTGEDAPVIDINASDYPTVMDAISVATSGDTVYLPPGTYVIDSTFELKTGVNLLGDSQNRPVLRINNGDALQITSNALKDVTISHLHFEKYSFSIIRQIIFMRRLAI